MHLLFFLVCWIANSELNFCIMKKKKLNYRTMEFIEDMMFLSLTVDRHQF